MFKAVDFHRLGHKGKGGFECSESVFVSHWEYSSLVVV
jgi:hypothetical protein